jgi:hypothetical protein
MRHTYTLSLALIVLATACSETVDRDELPDDEVNLDEADPNEGELAPEAGPSWPGVSTSAPRPTFELPNESLFSVEGLVTDELESGPVSGPQEIGILWLNLLDDNSTVVLEATTFEPLGDSFPAGFDLSILTPPSAAVRGTALISYDEYGQREEPIDRSRVAVGIVVVGNEGTLASLPATTSLGEFISGDGGEGTLLGQFSYVSPYTVRYVDGATAEGVTVRDINVVESIVQDFTVFDLRLWARYIDSALCRDAELGKGWETLEVNSCIEGGGEPNACLYSWFAARSVEVEAVCGAEPDSDWFTSPPPIELAPSESLELPLGIDDIRNAFSNGGYLFFLG